MSPNQSESPLAEIQRLIQAAEYTEARTQLMRYLKDRPDSAPAWYLLSLASSDPTEKRKAARKAIQLAPQDTRYQKHFERIQIAPASSGASSRRSLWMIGLLLLVLGAMALIFALASNVSDTTDPLLPTLVVLDESPPTLIAVNPENPSVEAPVEASPTEETLLAATLTEAPVVVEEASLEATVVVPSSTVTQTALPTETFEAQAVIISPTSPPINVLPVNTPIAPLAPELPTAEAPADQPTDPAQPAPPANTPVPAATALPTLTPPFPIPGGAGTALNRVGPIAAGDLRVIAATRNAEQAIRDMGGTVPSSVTGQRWMLLEMLYSCGTSCNISGLEYYVVSAGQAYPVGTGYFIDPVFGSNQVNNQYWGYLGFLVPSNEPNLRLYVRNGSETALFALE